LNNGRKVGGRSGKNTGRFSEAHEGEEQAPSAKECEDVNGLLIASRFGFAISGIKREVV
jgi:hypothetical protein